MRAKAKMKLRKVGDRYMLVDVSDKDASFIDVYTLNDTAAFIWTILSTREADEVELVAELSKTYDVDPETALSDVRCLVALWIASGLVYE